MNDFRPLEHRGATFEEIYPRYEFSELVRLAILIGAWVGGLLRSRRGGVRGAGAAPRRGNRPTAPAS